MLDVTSTTKGVLLPRMTDAQVNAIASPAEGLLVFNITNGCISVYVGGAWESICGAAGPKKIFVTNGTTNGDLGGPSGGDVICQGEATSAGLSGTFKALLSITGLDVIDRWGAAPEDFGGGIELPSGLLVANDWLDLDNSISTAVNQEADGTVITVSDVWTGLNPNTGNLFNGDNCNGWTNINYQGRYGLTNNTGYRWAGSSNSTCSALKRLYCVQQ